MAKHVREKEKKRPAMYYIATVLMILSLLGILFFIGRQVIPYFRASQLEQEIPKPSFSSSEQVPVTFSVLAAQSSASPVPEGPEASPEASPDRELSESEKRAQEIVANAEDILNGDEAETRFEETDAPINEAFNELLEINPDTVGWLTVGEIADYPVVKRDDDFYLHHNFKGQNDANGSIFMSQYNVLRPRDTVLLIYGHHMASGKMFGKLRDYRFEDYMLKNPLVQFRTIYADEEEHDTWYVPVSFFSASMIEGEVGYFDILPMYFENEEDHQAYLDAIVERSVWKAPTDVTTDDDLIMLITCSYDLVNSRYLLICRSLRDNETPEGMQELYRNSIQP